MTQNDFLVKILEEKRRLNQEKQAYFKSLKDKLGNTQFSQYHLFKKAISRPGAIHLIAEIKKASPSQGMLREDFDVAAIAKIYLDNKVAAISVLTEEKFFLGKPAYLQKVTENLNIPVLAKDFFIHEGQVFEARVNGASAILLIMAILNDDEFKHLMSVAHGLDLDCLVEVHDEKELERALKLGAEIIGINNRDLKTFVVDLKTAERLIPKIPKDKVIVAESGIKSHADILKLKDSGANAVLIGETFMREKNIDQKIKDIMKGVHGTE